MCGLSVDISIYITTMVKVYSIICGQDCNHSAE
jgi:hypothetical protein